MDDKDDNINDEEQEDNDNEESIKVVLIGESGVGKTSIIAQFTKGIFNQDVMSTNGATFSTKKKDFKDAKKTLSFEIWDTAGQEKYRSINKIFYQDASIAILVFDITRKDTFEALKNYWYLELRDNSPKDIVIAIAANKCDLYEYEEVSHDEVEEFGKSINALYEQTSAKTGEGIKDLFNSIGYKLLSPENYEDFLRKTSVVRLKSDSFQNVSNSTEKSEVREDIKKNCC
jgi:small GTP-binding protein